MTSARHWTYVIWFVFAIVVLTVLVARFWNQQKIERILRENELVQNAIPRIDQMEIVVESGNSVQQFALRDPSRLYAEISGEFEAGTGSIVEPYLIPGQFFIVHLKRVNDQQIIWRSVPSTIKMDNARFYFKIPIFRSVSFKPGAHEFVVSYSGQERLKQAFKFVEN